MSDCTGENCDHLSHEKDIKAQNEQPLAVEQMSQSETASPIITHNDVERFPLLECPSQPCSLPINDTDASMIGKMDALLDILDDAAAGLAAVQIGYPKRIFLLRQHGKNRAFINPVIVSHSRDMKRDGEACLSLPGFGVVFKRPRQVVLQYHDLDGEVKQETFNGFWARCVMHEMNHLDGILITQHLENEVSKQPSKTKFGMLLTSYRKSVIVKRRAQNKRARASRRANRGV